METKTTGPRQSPNALRLIPGAALAILAACDATGLDLPDEPTGPPAAPTAPSRPGPAAYRPQDGFVVHEWGTLTYVLGSDGRALPGLHHEEEDLPTFVADRMVAARANPRDERFVLDIAKTTKMETPVTYFYAPAARQVSVSVGFPEGMLTQWYPWVQRMLPQVYDVKGNLEDRWSQTLVSIPERCRAGFSADARGGLLDWGTVQILAPSHSVSLPGPIERTTWGFARNTAANPIEVTPAGERPQREKFLFYRGLGNLTLPLAATVSGGVATFRNTDGGAPMGGLFLMNVGPSGAGFAELGDLGPGAAVRAEPPQPALAHSDFVAAIKARLASRLVDDGLYTDEARSMVDTWERSYFLTPGVRLLYLLPQAYTDRIIPLAIKPAPDRIRRTMVIRLELLGDGQERQLVVHAERLASGDMAAEAFFLGLGRFAEPSLARATALRPDLGQSAGVQALVLRVRGQRRWAPAWAE